MTIGIAVLAAEGSNPPDHVILLADTKGSFGDEFSMNQLHKLFIDPKLGLYTVAADQMDKAAELFKTIHLFMTDLIGAIGYGRLFQAVHGASDTYKRIRFKYDILAGGRHIHAGSNLGCRTLVVFKGAGFSSLFQSSCHSANTKNSLP